ncbi:DUF423 domain-containing protein [Sphingobacteriales bacterium UPWRP_1]|nr:hypothetical protein BVG80_18150 [Sphingobacteriales bacterium TSM_CSM]PSJ73602.1 DUF423 domain-containing protein [Sphingobacteriales bacterium UPWRP_1]
MQKNFIVIAALLAAAAVMLGAFGAHGLKAKLTPDQLQVFETGVKYQFYHALGLFLLGLLMFQHHSNPLLVYAGYAFMAGILLFSGSLYLLANKTLLGIEGWRWLGPVTPLGGLSFIAGWLLLAAGVWRN